MISTTAFADSVGSATDVLRPPCPLTVEETGLPSSTIVDLMLKALYQTGSMTGEELSDFLALAFPVLDDLVLSQVEALGMSSFKNGDLYHNKYYLHSPGGRQGLFKVLGILSKTGPILDLWIFGAQV